MCIYIYIYVYIYIYMCVWVCAYIEKDMDICAYAHKQSSKKHIGRYTANIIYILEI